MKSKFPDFYDYPSRQCKICGWLLAPDLKFVIDHAKEKYHIKMKLEKEFGGLNERD